MSFGHPGISALEFAGGGTDAKDNKGTQSALKNRGKEKGKGKERTGSVASTTTSSSSALNLDGIDYQSIDAHLSPVSPEQLQQQRKKGASFVNHTPRRFELRRKPRNKTMGLGIDTTDGAPEPGTRKTASWTQYWHQYPPRDWSLSEALKKEGLEMPSETTTVTGSEEPDWASQNSRQLLRIEDIPGPLSSNPVLITPTEQSTSAVSVGALPEREIPERVSSVAATTVPPTRYRQKSANNNGKLKRRRRQTPFKIPVTRTESLKSMSSGRHSPLEPLVAMHRREASRELNASTKDMVTQEEDAGDGEEDRAVGVEEDAEGGAEEQPSPSPEFAVQSYFDSQASTSTASPPSIALPTSSVTSAPSPRNIPLPRSPSPEVEVTKSKASDHPGRVPALPSNDIAAPRTPTVPNRNPKRLSRDPHSSLQSHTFSTPGIRDSDFTSAAKGQYSPYSPSQRSPAVFSSPTSPTNRIASNSSNEATYQPQPLDIPKLRTAGGRIPSNLVVGHVGSSKLGRMAPPILGHEALTATAVLNDLSYYLKNTGPPSENSNSSLGRSRTAGKRRSGAAGGFRIFKVKGVGGAGANGKGKKRKKSKESSLAKRVGSVEGSPDRNREKEGQAMQRKTPACAKEMTTRGGAKHLRIVIPYSSDEQEGAGFGRRVELEGRAIMGASNQGKEMWTDEMLSPLAGEAVERAIAGKASNEGVQGEEEERLKTPTRSPKRSPIERKPVPVREHPLLTREEQTRARKLRDLERVKRQLLLAHAGMNGNAKLKGVGLERQARPSPAVEPSSGTDGVARNSNEVSAPQDSDSLSSKVRNLEQKVNALQRQNTQLAEALARIVGFEREDGEVDVEGVLKVYRQMRTGSGGDAFGYGGVGLMEQRRGRVFTR